MSADSALVSQQEFADKNMDWQTSLQLIFQPRIIVAILAIIGSVVFGAGLIMWTMKSDYVPVMPGLSHSDTARVADFLNSRNQPYSIDANTGLLLVPSAKVRALQIELASMGLQGNGTGQPEMLSENQPLGTSQFIEQARYQHSLEAELSRTVANLRNVDSARIHLALPKRSTFVRKQGNASASVMVRMMTGRALEKEQVRAIKSLVSSSVPYLESTRVTIVDEWGALLSGGSDDGVSEISDMQFVYSRKLEDHYVQRIKELLTPLVGADRIRASVAADVDFSFEEQTQEVFQPDSGQLRSEQNQQRRAEGGGATGIPGAVTNLPPEPPAPGADAGGDEATFDRNAISQNLTRNYELDKKISHSRTAPGKILRLSAAVVLDVAPTVPAADADAGGGADDAEPAEAAISDADIEQFTALVREAIGFDEERGDSVIVYSKAFQPPVELEPPPEASLWEKPIIWTLARQIGAALIVLVIALFIVRPALLSLGSNKPGASADAQQQLGGPDDIANDTLSLSQDARDGSGNAVKEAHGDILLMARTMARDDPKRVARVVKDWVESGGESGEK